MYSHITTSIFGYSLFVWWCWIWVNRVLQDVFLVESIPSMRLKVMHHFVVISVINWLWSFSHHSIIVDSLQTTLGFLSVVNHSFPFAILKLLYLFARSVSSYIQETRPPILVANWFWCCGYHRNPSLWNLPSQILLFLSTSSFLITRISMEPVLWSWFMLLCIITSNLKLQ